MTVCMKCDTISFTFFWMTNNVYQRIQFTVAHWQKIHLDAYLCMIFSHFIWFQKLYPHLGFDYYLINGCLLDHKPRCKWYTISAFKHALLFVIEAKNRQIFLHSFLLFLTGGEIYIIVISMGFRIPQFWESTNWI